MACPALLANLAAGMFILPFFLFSATAGPARRQVRQGAPGPPGQGCWKWRSCGIALAGFCAAQPGGADGGAVPARLSFDPVRAGQVRAPAAASSRRRAGRRQRADRSRHLRGDPDRHAGRRPAGRFGRACRAVDSRRRLRRGTGRLPDQPGCAGGAGAGPRNSRSILNPLSETWRNIAFARENQPVFLSILGISWFWLYGALFLAQFPAYAKIRAGRRRKDGNAAAGHLYGRHRASVRCCASGCRAGTSKSAWCLSAPSA